MGKFPSPKLFYKLLFWTFQNKCSKYTASVPDDIVCKASTNWTSASTSLENWNPLLVMEIGSETKVIDWRKERDIYKSFYQ